MIFSNNFLIDLPRLGRGTGDLESLVERVDRILQFRDRSRVLYVEGINPQGQLVYMDIQIPLLFQERLKTLFLYLFVIPAIIVFIIKIIIKVALYYKYRGCERWSEQTTFISPPEQLNESLPYIFTKDQLKAMNFHLPPLDRENLDIILNEHQRLRNIGRKSILNRMGIGIKSKIDSDDLLGDNDDIFFTHPDFPRLKFESMGSYRINNQPGYSPQEWADLHVLDYLSEQREELSKLRGFTNPRTIGIRRIRTDPAGNHVLIIRER
ncbi:hypothetical protein C834K_0589 [Chlamydia poikilotherma]|uniref:Uncharacterized protein n=2 Tax=Chlamydia poikilotherma TaxID=1967783 RepID=A0A3B0PPC4_9CHLA|nr:hypothetical protein C834K_0589 [Chlamydia poikilotherma]